MPVWPNHPYFKNWKPGETGGDDLESEKPGGGDERILKAGKDFDLINPEDDPRYREFWQEYYRLTARRGVSREDAKIEMRRRNTLIGAMTMRRGEADGMICGTFGTHALHLQHPPPDAGHNLFDLCARRNVNCLYLRLQTLRRRQDVAVELAARRARQFV